MSSWMLTHSDSIALRRTNPRRRDACEPSWAMTSRGSRSVNPNSSATAGICKADENRIAAVPSISSTFGTCVQPQSQPMFAAGAHHSPQVESPPAQGPRRRHQAACSTRHSHRAPRCERPSPICPPSIVRTGWPHGYARNQGTVSSPCRMEVRPTEGSEARPNGQSASGSPTFQRPPCRSTFIT